MVSGCGDVAVEDRCLLGAWCREVVRELPGGKVFIFRELVRERNERRETLFKREGERLFPPFLLL